MNFVKRLGVDTVTVHKVDKAELERFISEVYGSHFDIPCGNKGWREWTNREIDLAYYRQYSSWSMSYDQILEELRKQGRTGHLLVPILLNMVAMGLIPDGSYFIIWYLIASGDKS